jgi:hypothetical protein
VTWWEGAILVVFVLSTLAPLFLEFWRLFNIDKWPDD